MTHFRQRWLYRTCFVGYLHYSHQNHYKQQNSWISLSCEAYSCTSTHGIPQLSYNDTVHYTVHHGLSPVHYAPHNTISYVWPKGIITCTFPITFPNQNIAFISHATCTLHAPNPHYDATQYAASCCTKLLKSKYFTQLPIPKHTQFAVISPVRYSVLWPHKTVNKYSCLYFNLQVSK